MIKVTFKDNSIIDYSDYRSHDNKIVFHEDGRLSYFCLLDDVVKVEKQIKDLTLTEANKLDIELYDYEAYQVEYDSYGGKGSTPISWEAYIDITHWIKKVI